MTAKKKGQWRGAAAGLPTRRRRRQAHQIRGRRRGDGVCRRRARQYYGADGKLITESLKDYTRRAVQKEFASLDDFLRRWNATDRKQVLFDELANQGILLEALAEDVGSRTRSSTPST